MDFADLDAIIARAEDNWNALQRAAMDEIMRCQAVVGPSAPRVIVKWDVTGLHAGWCRYGRNGEPSILRLNPHIARHEGDEYLNTVAHEYAHAVIGHNHGRPHGEAWQMLMWRFGHIPNRCHSYQSAQRARNRR